MRACCSCVTCCLKLKNAINKLPRMKRDLLLGLTPFMLAICAVRHCCFFMTPDPLCVYDTLTQHRADLPTVRLVDRNAANTAP